MKSFEEKLEECLDKIYAYESLHNNPIPMVGGIEEAKLALLNLLDEEMPEERDRDVESRPNERMWHELGGWNSYRTELRKRLGMKG